METNNPNPYFREILPWTDEHRDFIQCAIVEQDRNRLQALKGRLHKPVHLVSNWVGYGLVCADNNMDAVVIFDDTQIKAMETFEKSLQPVEA